MQQCELCLCPRHPWSRMCEDCATTGDPWRPVVKAWLYARQREFNLRRFTTRDVLQGAGLAKEATPALGRRMRALLESLDCIQGPNRAGRRQWVTRKPQECVPVENWEPRIRAWVRDLAARDGVVMVKLRRIAVEGAGLPPESITKEAAEQVRRIWTRIGGTTIDRHYVWRQA